ncbi:4-(cytidine 5'-diphospho)-2-C-methyl-D-erythritol kinase [Sphingobacterium paucimobilis]|uniref:4-diphosphocytidyl-2-C-methyl-D-erythritol kinase n=1 Tax=Sphingobacterium paucimobilis HER1398 TaxID=1346330 RepID=U2HP73_9SPHI|nr:4-(cytidine 5'-diphospho)-2-C-methyl-D-erythritol kinase [Sphingobacterium paucimobilis]ERJ57262.1 hypothetical protein M472_00635 [Sphingobacterium paucimobilis HER1398]
MISFANAKINLGLLVTEKRGDGYHNIETVFFPVKLYDVIEITPSERMTFQVDGLAIPDGGSNLCEKAFQLLDAAYGIAPVHIHLLKNIPIGAGLGGGSSDAAHVLKMLSTYNSLDLSTEQLQSYAAQLGADCPFFVTNKPVFASGIGTTFEDVELDLSNYFIAVVKPDIHISTVEAYQCVVPQTPVSDLKRAIQLPIQEWKYHLVNDFELGVFERYPLIEKIKHSLYEKGAIYAAMSGSGSAVFGIFESRIDLQELEALGMVYYPVDL